MSATVATPPGDRPAAPTTALPRLVAGTELIGQLDGSGLREPPHLARRCDGQVVALSELLFVIAGHLDGSDATAVARRAGDDLGLRIRPDQLEYVVAAKLAPLGLVTADGSPPPDMAARDVLLGLRYRARLVPERAVRRLAAALSPLFAAPVVVLALAATDVWLIGHGIGAGVDAIIRTPTLAVGVFGTMFASLLWHELGHAAACHRGGAEPGRIGAGIYIVWPALYTDVTDSYRLSRRGRLRTDLGGIYFNGLCALGAMGAYVATRYPPLLVLVLGQQLIALDQFSPWMRLDGYHVVSDLIGVSDLFERIGPVLASLRPGRPPHPRVAELEPWARRAVTVWVLTTVCLLVAMLTLLAVNLPTYAVAGWRSIALQSDRLAHAASAGDVALVMLSAIGIAILALPAVGLLLSYQRLCRAAGLRLALRATGVTPTRRA